MKNNETRIAGELLAAIDFFFKKKSEAELEFFALRYFSSYTLTTHFPVVSAVKSRTAYRLLQRL